MSKSVFELIIDLISALVKLAFPLIILIIVLIFKKEISGILKRIKKGKILGQEIELSEEIDKLGENIVQESKNLPFSIDSKMKMLSTKEEVKLNEEAVVIIKGAEEKPIEAVELAKNQVEKELINLIATYGLIKYFEKGFNFFKAVALLQNRGVISSSTAISLRNYYELRNKITHDPSEANKDEIIRFVDLGIVLAGAISAIPRETYEVYEPNVEIFKDAKCSVKYAGVWGILLKVISPGGKIENFRIYPTTRKDYKKGQVLSWEWDLSKTWGEAWYKEPGTDNIKTAWTEAGEFVGRPLEAVREVVLG
jgi:hypothetical protein